MPSCFSMPVYMTRNIAHERGVEGLGRVCIAGERFGNRKQVPLKHLRHRRGFVVRGQRARQANLRDELVDGAVRLDTCIAP